MFRKSRPYTNGKILCIYVCILLYRIIICIVMFAAQGVITKNEWGTVIVSLGAIRGAMVKDKWSWITDSQTLDYDLWQPYYPHLNADKDCLVVYSGGRDTDSFGLTDDYCTNPFPYICETYLPYVHDITLYNSMFLYCNLS
jgi:hypothetical protein